MSLKLYNTLTREKEEFEPLEDQVKIYTCGQTIYDDLHVGNARAYAVWDILRRYLEWKGYDVFHIQNITDVGHLTDDADQGEDKVEKRANEKGMEPMVLVEDQIKRYYEDMDALNIKRHHINPRATCHVPEMIDLNKKILENGYAYESNGNLYFDVKKYAEDYDYGKMGGIDLDELEEGSRVGKDPNKKNQYDFALWINADPSHIMKWNSPWSKGYPGWHLECSTMSMKYLGEEFDIHGGGKDHIFPHHPNERAQSKAATGKDMAQFWLHSDFVTIDGEKMSKSKGNFYTAREMIEKYSGEVLRMFYATTHYRKEIDFNEDALENAQNNLDRLYNTIRLVDESEGGGEEDLTDITEGYRNKFEEAMDDDLNTAKAVNILVNYSKEINKSLNNKKEILEEAKKTLTELGKVLGIKLELKKETAEINEEMVEKIIEVRNDLREKEEYELSDKLRNALSITGIKLEDKGDKTKWKLKN